MVATILNGKQVAFEYKKNLKNLIELQKKQGMRAPGLAVILVGEDPASTIYVNHKRQACLEIGIKSYAYNLPENIQESDLLALIDRLNAVDEIDGILIQLPLPPQINTQAILESIDYKKDVDGFHPYNVGRLAQKNPFLRPCTPYGIIKLLEYYNIPLMGKHAVVIGASNIVGRPMALEFLLAKATVSICHSYTQNLASYIQSADIIVTATGKIDIISTDWININQVVVDVGMHRLPNGTLRGDVDFNQAKNKAGWITPVPGGVGPMTVAMLLHNTCDIMQRKYSLT